MTTIDKTPEQTARTHVRTPDPDAPPPVPRAGIGQLPAETRFLGWGARIGAAGMAWIIVERLLPVHGWAWLLVVFALVNAVILAVGTAMSDSRIAVADRIAEWAVSTGAIVVFGGLATVIFFVVGRGWAALHHPSFLSHTMKGVGPQSPLTSGGILQAIVGTLIEITIAVAITLPLGLGTAVFMNEIGGRFAHVVRTVVDAMTALPSIVAGLFIYTVAIIYLHLPSSGLAGALAISVMMLPIIARAADVVLRVVPGSLREASLALGASRWRTVWQVVLPTARPGLATALILGIARGIGETSPVLINSGNASFLVTDPTHGMMSSLPLFIFSTVRTGIPLQIDRAFGAGATLLILVLILFVIARVIARPPSAEPSAWRRLRSRTRRSTSQKASAA